MFLKIIEKEGEIATSSIFFRMFKLRFLGSIHFSHMVSYREQYEMTKGFFGDFFMVNMVKMFL